MGTSALLLSAVLQLAPTLDGDSYPVSEPRIDRTDRVVVVHDGASRELDVPAPRALDPQIRIDGRLDDAGWDAAAILSGFTQYEPLEGVPASERTEVRVLVSDEALYFAARAFDSTGGVRATLTERDGFGRSDDYVRFLVDTFNDRRRAYAFTVNPLGVQGDGVWVEGRSGGRRFGGPIDSNPDFLWESAGRVEPDGYSVEVRIPLKTLRFPESDIQDWGLQVVRRIQRTGYEESWAPITSERSSRLAQAGSLRGLRGLDAGLFMEVNPTAIGSRQGAFDADHGGLLRDPARADFGLNVAYGLTSNLTLDGTVNPDFSQIEADAGQIAVNERFALFLPEKRPFFLEGTDVFSMSERLVYTRSIVNPIAAAKLSGKVGGVQVAYLGAVDDEASTSDAIVNLVRLKGDVGRSSTLGLAYTDRTRPGLGANRVLGADARLVLGGRYTVTVLGAASADRDGAAPTAWSSLLSASVDRAGRAFDWSASFEDVGEDFRARSGFIRRTGITQMRGRTGYGFRGERGALVESWGPFVEASGTWERSDFWAGTGAQETELELGLRASLRGNIGGFASVRRSSFDFDAGDYASFASGPDAASASAFAKPTGVFDGLYEVRLRSWLSSWERARISLGAGWEQTPIFAGPTPIDRGESWSGDVGVTLYPTGSLQAELGARFVTILRDRDGSTYSTATIPRIEARYQFSRALFVRGIGEYSSQARGDVLDPRTGDPVYRCGADCSALSGSDRHDFRLEGLMAYEPSPGSVVFIGYTRQFRDARAFRFREVETRADGLFVKLSYRFRM